MTELVGDISTAHEGGGNVRSPASVLVDFLIKPTPLTLITVVDGRGPDLQVNVNSINEGRPCTCSTNCIRVLP
ncbi:hypothetical protein [Saccharothrix algeriensis]|uniref:hypothetical protein n=1 Tax=Saccharothrix algeriensis TaxID=173560 RepID=UPI00195A3CDE|nr:hypothetical protein [Saccharothrix algeriensis]